MSEIISYKNSNTMTKREEYKLEFTKQIVNGQLFDNCRRNAPVHDLNYLGGFLQDLYMEEIDDFIVQIDGAINGDYYEEHPQSQGYVHYDVQIAIPNFLLGTPGSTKAVIPLTRIIHEFSL